MPKREIPNLALKIKLTNEYLRSGGIEKIFDQDLLRDLIDAKYDADGITDTDTITPRLNAFMTGILHLHLSPPSYSAEHISEYESLTQKSIFFEQTNIDTVEEFDKVYDEYKTKNDILFRGQREAKWRLYSTLQRQWILERLFEGESNYQHLIEKLVNNGKLKFIDEIKSILNERHIDTENDISVLAYLQHNKCPTPLLDWSFKIQNALYFGMDGLSQQESVKEVDGYFSVYFLEEKYLEPASMRTITKDGLDKSEEFVLSKMISSIAKDEETKRKMEKFFKGRKAIDRKRINGSGLIAHMLQIKHILNFPITYFSDNDYDSGVVFSLNNSKNILNQVGVFTWNSDPTKPFEMVGEEEYKKLNPEDNSDEYRFCKCFNINKNLVDQIRTRLEEDGITKEFIYPTTDIDSYDIFEKSK